MVAVQRGDVEMLRRMFKKVKTFLNSKEQQFLNSNSTGTDRIAGKATLRHDSAPEHSFSRERSHSPAHAGR